MPTPAAMTMTTAAIIAIVFSFEMSSDNLSLSNYDRLEQKKQYNSVKNNKLFKFIRF